MNDKTIPNFLDRLSSDEYQPQPYSATDRQAIARTEASLHAAAERQLALLQKLQSRQQRKR